MIGKLVAHRLTVVVVIFDERDSNFALFLTRNNGSHGMRTSDSW